MSRPPLYIDFVFSRKYTWSEKLYRERQSYPVKTTWAEVLKEWAARDDVLRPIRREWRKYTDLGGYPMFYVTKDNGVLCPDCANKNLKLTLGDDPQWQIVDADINYEDHDLYCDNCSGTIEAAYGEPNSEEEEEEGITAYFDELSTAEFPNGAWAATYGAPADGVDTAYGVTKEEAISRLKAGKYGED